MTTLTVTSKGQVTLRKELLKHRGVVPGDKVVVEQRPDGKIEVSAVRRTRKIAGVFGSLKQEDGPRLTIDEIKEIATRG